MKYIDKNNSESIKVAATLHEWRDNYKNAKGDTFAYICKTQKADTVWELLDPPNQTCSKEMLRKAFYDEQKGICCYCGKEIDLADNLPIEHFLPKSKDKFNNTYTYKNLMLSCTGNKRIGKHDVKKGETWEEIAKLYDMTTEELKRKNYGKNLEEKTALTVNPPPTHCDAHKGEKTDEIINPTEDENCWERLEYEYNENIKCENDDAIAENTIKVLNLNAEVLKKERERVWREFKNNFYSKDLLIVMQNFGVDEKQAVIKLLNKSLENDKTYSFCVVVRAFLKNIINSKPKIPPSVPSPNNAYSPT